MLRIRTGQNEPILVCGSVLSGPKSRDANIPDGTDSFSREGLTIAECVVFGSEVENRVLALCPARQPMMTSRPLTMVLLTFGSIFVVLIDPFDNSRSRSGCS